MNRRPRIRNDTVLRALTLAVLLCCPASLLAQEASHDELLRLHRSMLERMIIHHDVAEFERLALDQLRLIPPGGILETKAEVMVGVGAFDVEKVSIEDEVVIQEGTTVVVISKMTLHGEVRPVGRLGPMRTMSVFVHMDGEWRLLARSLTPCLPVAIRSGRC